MVRATDRSAGACVFATAVAAGCAGGLVDLRASAGANCAWTFAGLADDAEEGPATGKEEAVGVETWASFGGTLRTSDDCVCGGEAAVVDVEAWGEDCFAGGILSLIFPFDGRCGSLGVYCGTA